MSWRVTVESLPGAASADTTPIEVDAPSWVVALRTARELFGFGPADPRELSVEVRDNLWRVADRSLGRLFIVETVNDEPASEKPVAVPLAPPAPADIACDLRTHVAHSAERPFDYFEETLVAARLASLDVAHTWIKLRLAAWRAFKGADSARWLLRLFVFADVPASDEAEPIAFVEFRSWSGKVEILPPEDSLAAAASGAHAVPSAPVLEALQPSHVPTAPRIHVPTPVDVALVGSVVPPPRPSMSSNVDLIGSIFDSVHDVHFAPTVIDGADLLCDIAFRNIPCAAAVIFFHDINNAGWILASGSGEGAATVFGDRLPATDALLARMTQRRGAVRVSGEACTHVLHLGRAPKHALVAPASVGGRVYGAIELVDPPSGQPFTESQEHALAYLAEQFAAFAAARGLLVREDDIRARRR
jgi:hypothetical protein